MFFLRCHFSESIRPTKAGWEVVGREEDNGEVMWDVNDGDVLDSGGAEEEEPLEEGEAEEESEKSL